MVLIIRSDLRLTKGKIASQASHAAVMCFKKTLESNPMVANKWLALGQPKIVLKIDSLTEMEILHKQAMDSGITNVIIHDAGRTQIAAGTATALGLGPDYNDKIDTLVKDLKLL